MNAPEKPWYVYAFCDPDTEEPFYIGKGTQDRMKQQSQSSRNQATLYRIHHIQAQGKRVLRKKLAEFDLEEDAYLYEWAMINVYYEQLTNIRGNATKTAKKHAFPAGTRPYLLLSAKDQARYVATALAQLDIHAINGYISSEEAAMILSWRTKMEKGIDRHYRSATTAYPRYDVFSLFRSALFLIKSDEDQHIRTRPIGKGA